jgi:hypothetical protein
MTSEYIEKLRDPRWQKKRLEIMQRDGFKCRECSATDKTLNVHHCFYKYGNDPWDYPEGSLVTLCEDCHECESSKASDAKSILIKSLAGLGFRADHYFLLFEKVVNDFLASLPEKDRN